MSRLFYTFKISTPTGAEDSPLLWEQRLQYPSKHIFPSPLGTWLHSFGLDDILFHYIKREHGKELFDDNLPSLLEVVGYEDHHDTGDFYMWLGTGEEEDADYTSLGIETIHAKELVAGLKKQGWEDCPWG